MKQSRSSIRTLFILTAAPPEQPGGIEHVVRLMMQGFTQRSYRVQVFHYGNSIPRPLREKGGRSTILLKSALDNYFIGTMAQRCMTDEVVAVISNGTIGWYRFRQSSQHLKQIHFYHGTYRAASNAILPCLPRRNYPGYLRTVWWESMVKENLSGRGKICVANSDQIRDEVKLFFGHPCSTVWLPLDTDHFSPMEQTECRIHLGLDVQRPAGLFVGHTGLVKNFAMVKRLIDWHPEIQWVLALRGTVPEILRKQGNVTIFNNAPYDLLPILYNAADFALCPSYNEPFGYVVVEALACGTPVIATPGGASRLFLQGDPMGALLIADPDDKEGFAQAIAQVLDDWAGYRQEVMNRTRPHIEDIMQPDNWWRRFLAVTGL
jgi:glycosyltransferase involved in cell wall biosynthesis